MSNTATRLKVVFMGSPEFALPCLQLLQKETELLAVVSAPDRPAGRGKQMSSSPVATYAREHKIPLLQPERLKNPEFLDQLKSLQADLFVVVAFRMLPEAVWNMPPMGTLNVHASLLPQLRGAAPIQWAIAHGLKETGLTTFRLKHEIDTGDILEQLPLPVAVDETGGSLYEKLMQAAPGLLLNTLNGLAANTLVPRPQEWTGAETLLPAPKIQRQHAFLHPEMPVQQAERWIRAFDPIPGAALALVLESGERVEIKVKQARLCKETEQSGLKVAFVDGELEILRLQPAGKGMMDAAAFLRGLRHPVRGWQPLVGSQAQP
jgi:methionyl-tRNA formyltransferase